MAKIPSKVSQRIVTGIKRYQPILASARSRDVGESDTVTIIVDMLADVFGYEKFLEITSEHAIKGTFCDLAVKLEGKLEMLIEVKAIGIDLKEAHVKQAIDYAANQGVDWVVLTNGVSWRVYKVTFAKPIGQELVIELDFASLAAKNAKDVDALYLFCKEGWMKSVLGEYHTQKQALSRFCLGAMILSDTILQVLRRELRRMSPDVRVEVEDIKEVLINEVIKRDVLEGDKATDARKKVTKAENKQLKAKSEKPKVKVEDTESVEKLEVEPAEA
jgi:hypothetical protein